MNVHSINLLNFNIQYSWKVFTTTIITTIFTAILLLTNYNTDIIKRLIYLPIIFIGYILILHLNYIFIIPLLLIASIEYWYQPNNNYKFYKNRFTCFLIYFIYIITIVYSFFIFMTYDIATSNIDFIIITCSLMDTYSYIFGKLLGNRIINKPVPIISNVLPKKTYEGYILGSISTIGFLYYMNYNLLSIILLSFASIVGDLTFSLVKRFRNIKDFSNILGNHGGILDRIDSHIMAFIVFHIFYS